MDEHILHRTFAHETHILDEQKGIVEYVASDESVDSYREVIRVSGWRFNRFKKNSPFLDSHDDSTVANVLGKVLDARVEKNALVETVQWAVDVPENKLAQYGFAMTKAGYLRAVSVGFIPIRSVSKYDQDSREYEAQLASLNLPEGVEPQRIYLQQEQVELSAVVIGANPNAVSRVVRAHLDGVVDDGALDLLIQRCDLLKRTGQPVSEAVVAASVSDTLGRHHCSSSMNYMRELIERTCRPQTLTENLRRLLLTASRR